MGEIFDVDELEMDREFGITLARETLSSYSNMAESIAITKSS